jgi:hypothetical protein
MALEAAERFQKAMKGILAGPHDEQTAKNPHK